MSSIREPSETVDPGNSAKNSRVVVLWSFSSPVYHIITPYQDSSCTTNEGIAIRVMDPAFDFEKFEQALLE